MKRQSLKAKYHLPFKFTINKIRVTTRVIEDGTRVSGI